MIEEHLYTSDEKLAWWGYGEWIEEPDKVSFEHLGVECKIIRMVDKDLNSSIFGGHLCGYVKVPDGHKCFGKHYDDIEMDVYQGLTYGEINNEKHPYLPKDGHWIGFDCAHSGDYIPSMEYLKKTACFMKSIRKYEQEMKERFNMHDSPIFKKEYRNIRFCINECKSMAEQLVNMINTK